MVQHMACFALHICHLHECIAAHHSGKHLRYFSCPNKRPNAC